MGNDCIEDKCQGAAGERLSSTSICHPWTLQVFRPTVNRDFCLLMSGFFTYSVSASGIWLVTHLTIQGLASLFMGYEMKDLKAC
jgi:hypothetical protein